VEDDESGDNTMRLNGKIALVTGVAGPRGIGYASARRLAEEGAFLAIADISKEVHQRAKELEKVTSQILSFDVDLTRLSDVQRMVGSVVERYGRVDILANIAGLAPRGSAPTVTEKHFVDLTEEEWASQIAINLTTTFNCIKAVLPIMINQRYGKIVNMSSVTGTRVAIPGDSAYATAKGGVSGLTKTLALEVGGYGITVNAIAPGWIHTGSSPESEVKAGLSTPMKRPGRPEEVANLVLFLASDESSYLTGHDIIIDGGNILQEYKGANSLELH
jgi:3-oxoacyl-[acyl-carrier protein] reductase